MKFSDLPLGHAFEMDTVFCGRLEGIKVFNHLYRFNMINTAGWTHGYIEDDREVNDLGPLSLCTQELCDTAADAY